MWLRRWVVILICGLICYVVQGTLHEADARTRATHSLQKPAKKKMVIKQVPSPALPDYEAALLADADTGQILFARNSDKQWPSASLTKMMVGLLTLEEIKRGHLSLRTPVPISRRASLAGGRMINLQPGEVYPLEELLQAMLVTSANDASIAIAERLAGSVESCILAMNKRARELGMTETRYRTVNGMPPANGAPPDMSSARDMVILARELLKHREILQWTSCPHIPFRAGTVLLPNTNHLVGKVAGVDGLKTGFTAKARFNLVTTAQRGQLRLIAVILGGKSSQVRFRTATELLEWGFAEYTRLRLLKSGEPVGARVRVEHGSVSAIQPVAATDVAFLMKKNDIDNVQISLQLPSTIAAPIARYQVVGEVVVRNHDRILAVIPAVSPLEIPQVHWFPARR